METHETVLTKPASEIPAENVTDVARQPTMLPPAVEPPEDTVNTAVASLPKPSLPETTEPTITAPENPVAGKTAHITVKRTKHKAMRFASRVAHNRHLRHTRQYGVTQAVSDATPPAKKATLWDKLKKLPWKSPFGQ